MELLVEMVNSLYQWTIATKFSVLDAETVPPLNIQGFMIRLFSFLQALFSRYIVSKIIS